MTCYFTAYLKQPNLSENSSHHLLRCLLLLKMKPFEYTLCCKAVSVWYHVDLSQIILNEPLNTLLAVNLGTFHRSTYLSTAFLKSLLDTQCWQLRITCLIWPKYLHNILCLLLTLKSWNVKTKKGQCIAKNIYSKKNLLWTKSPLKEMVSSKDCTMS